MGNGKLLQFYLLMQMVKEPTKLFDGKIDMEAVDHHRLVKIRY